MINFAAYVKLPNVITILLLASIGCANIAGIEDAQLQTAGSTGGTPGTSTQDTGLCATYCETVMANCQNALSLYASQETCIGVCNSLQRAGKAGTPGDQSGNTIQCRLTQARNAKATGEPASYCFAAGPGGGNICGTDCEGYCVLLQQTCPNEFASPQFNNSVAYCLTTACPSIPLSDAGFTASIHGEGNNMNCRLYHVSASNADAQAAGIHCSHAAGAAPCVD
jgi:hypothetical protein